MKLVERIVCTATLLTLVNGCTLERVPAVTHVVICELNNPYDVEATKRIIDKSEDFRTTIPGLVHVYAGAGHPAMPGKSSELRCDVGIVMIFDSVGSLDDYQKNPDHLRAVEEILKPVVKKAVTYDFFESLHNDGKLQMLWP